MKKHPLVCALMCILFMPSCTQVGTDGRRWLSIPLPPDPLREFVIEACSRKMKPPTASPTQVPPGYMFSAHKVQGGYDVRGITGPSKVLPDAEFTEFSKVCKDNQWGLYMH